MLARQLAPLTRLLGLAPPPQARLLPDGREAWLGGEYYTATLSGIHGAFLPRRYFEIGTLNGATLTLATCASLAVDPQFQLTVDVAANKPSCILRETTSDDFFAHEDPAALLGGPIDLAFLDGMHHFEFLLRDFINTERFCTPRSMIVMHDCCPLDAHMTRRHDDLFVQRPTNYPHYWTGDVWKIVPVLRKLRPDLKIVCLDAPPTGLVVVTRLDPSNRTLETAHDDIRAEWDPVTLEEYGVARLFAECRLQSATAWRGGLRPVA